MRCGHGKEVKEDGKVVYEGKWSEDKKNGLGTETVSSGTENFKIIKTSHEVAELTCAKRCRSGESTKDTGKTTKSTGRAAGLGQMAHPTSVPLKQIKCMEKVSFAFGILTRRKVRVQGWKCLRGLFQK